jgi:hypothetical protein
VDVGAADSPPSLQPAARKQTTRRVRTSRRTPVSVGPPVRTVGSLAAWHELRLPCGGSVPS